MHFGRLGLQERKFLCQNNFIFVSLVGIPIVMTPMQSISSIEYKERFVQICTTNGR